MNKKLAITSSYLRKLFIPWPPPKVNKVYMALKIDIKKVFDRLELSFMKHILTFFIFSKD